MEMRVVVVLCRLGEEGLDEIFWIVTFWSG
jgi:hypothetical protein